MTDKDSLFTYINKLNIVFNKITADYSYLSSNITNLLNNELILYDSLTELEISMNDLSINIQSILFIIEETKKQNEFENINYNENYIDYFEKEKEKEKKNDVLVNNTVKRMLPYLFLYLMLIDKESILNSSSFGNNNIDDKLNGCPNINNNDINNINKLNNMYIPDLD